MIKPVAATTAAWVVLAWASASAAVTLPNSNPIPCLFGANGNAASCAAVGIRNYTPPVAGVFGRSAPLVAAPATNAAVTPVATLPPITTAAVFMTPAAPATSFGVVEAADVIDAPTLSRSAPVPLPAAAWALLLGLLTLASVGRRT